MYLICGEVFVFVVGFCYSWLVGMRLYWTGNVGGWVQLYREVLPGIVRWHNRGRMFGLRCLLPIANGTNQTTNQPTKKYHFFVRVLSIFKGFFGRNFAFPRTSDLLLTASLFCLTAQGIEALMPSYIIHSCVEWENCRSTFAGYSKSIHYLYVMNEAKQLRKWRMSLCTMAPAALY